MKSINTSAPAPIDNTSNIRILLHDKISYNCDITIVGNELKEIPHYTRTFYADRDFTLCTINLSIPYTGNCKAYGRSKIVLFLDQEPICTEMMVSHSDWDLSNKTMIVNYPFLKKGEHKIYVKAAVDDGRLFMPHFLVGALDTAEPAIFGLVTVVGTI